MPTNFVILSKNSIFCDFSETFPLIISSGVYNPAPNFVALIISIKRSCKNRNGGFDNNFSVSFGFVMIGPNKFLVVSQFPSHPSISASNPGGRAIIPLRPLPSTAGFSRATPRVPPRLLPLSASTGSSSLRFTSSISTVFESPVSDFDSRRLGLDSFTSPLDSCFDCLPLGLWSCLDALAPATSPPSTRRTASAPSPLDAQSANADRSMLVFSGSNPATILAARTSTGAPLQMPTTFIIFSKYAIFWAFSETFEESLSSASYNPFANEVVLITAEIVS
mmetsp:Transcript_3975/g.4059  ORF Transcript_3975/g.4059 Transcript_3975/m.4059 type:complete len:278 (+) Transcript_3975:1317-2150(+)